ncbi:CerR family C-terminal domain-containing protein [Francisella sp. 19X1-34]|uniref:CerR family C-terminal domain-containing protein n=1 Tax=Francisella sp. 19X1-34 TaxID=3087177 RepID=UPI002E3511E3|nr:CerR family C-terminal domain-containing protein [Francisella sp. 19X1-34]MED7787784.1 CerR family C-terminal domain-containing protein [Francisella sp. 19X1-34]
MTDLKNDEAKKINTKQALIDAGLKLFGEYGPDATSTRMIVELANVNISAIKYYFGSKKGLYFAVVKHIVSSIRDNNSNTIDLIKQKFYDNNISVEDSKLLYKKLLLSMANFLIGNDKSQDWSRIIMREQANPTEAFDIMYESYMKQIQGILIKLSSIFYNCAVDEPILVIRQQIMFGQVLSFVIAKESFLRASTEKNIKTIKKQVIDQLSICIDSIIATPI